MPVKIENAVFTTVEVLWNNYRPISLLSVPSKLLERIVHNGLLKYLLENDLLSPSQFGFRPLSFTQEALVTVTNDWHQYLDCGKDTASIFFDLSKAFDVLPHSVILDALVNVGVHGPLYSWFESYLLGRSQRVVLDGYTSQAASVSSGVPQGSILGPLLFILAMNPLTNVSLSINTRLILYADDILVYKPIRCYLDRVALQNDVNIIVDWIDFTGLRLNPTKTKLMVLSRRPHPTQLQITVASSIVTQVTSIEQLGVTVTSNLSWSAHIDNTCVKARKQLGLLYRHFHPAGRRALSRLYKSTVLSLLDYCACVWDPHQVTKIQKLEAAQRFAAKLATGLWSSGCQDPIQLMNWPTLATCRKRQKLLLCRRILLGGSIMPSSIFTPHPHHSPRLHLPIQELQPTYTHFSLALWNCGTNCHPNLYSSVPKQLLSPGS